MEAIANSVLRVGEGGRGFVTEARRERIVITAAHCLPFFPPRHSWSYMEERTYPALLGPLGEAPTVWTECLFVDPIADIAVLGSPDDQEFHDEAEAFEALMEKFEPLKVGNPHDGETVSARLFSLDGRLFGCKVQVNRLGLAVRDIAEKIDAGMSGSPILADDGSAIWIVVVGRSHGLSSSPRLIHNLPGWFLVEALRKSMNQIAAEQPKKKAHRLDQQFS
jgi:hypothetical protein